MSAGLAMQQLVVAALADLPGVTGVWDGPPADAAPPYISIGADVLTDWGTKTEAGHEHRLALNLWHAGPGMAPAKALLGAMETRLRAMAGSAAGHRLVSVRLARSLVLSGPDGLVQGVLEVRLRSVAQ